MFTIPSTQPHLRLMLADTPSPRGSGASLATVGYSVGVASARFVTSPHLTRRILLMEQQVWSYNRQTINHATSCRSDNQPCDLVSQR